jgi:hypothetical protein
MKKLRIALYIIGTAQIILGMLALVAPGFFIETAMKLTATSPDMGYPLGMLASRFLVLGAGMFIIAKNPAEHLLLINGMIVIQVIDLLVGIFYTATGVVSISASGLPMFDALLFIVLLSLWKPKS